MAPSESSTKLPETTKIRKVKLQTRRGTQEAEGAGLLNR